MRGPELHRLRSGGREISPAVPARGPANRAPGFPVPCRRDSLPITFLARQGRRKASRPEWKDFFLSASDAIAELSRESVQKLGEVELSIVLHPHLPAGLVCLEDSLQLRQHRRVGWMASLRSIRRR